MRFTAHPADFAECRPFPQGKDMLCKVAGKMPECIGFLPPQQYPSRVKTALRGGGKPHEGDGAPGYAPRRDPASCLPSILPDFAENDSSGHKAPENHWHIRLYYTTAGKYDSVSAHWKISYSSPTKGNLLKDHPRQASSKTENSYRLARIFVLPGALLTEGILCVFRGRQSDGQGKRTAKMHCFMFESLPHKKGSVAKSHSPRTYSRFAMSATLLCYAHADRTLRPLARRRAKTLRPLEVAILWRKP